MDGTQLAYQLTLKLLPGNLSTAIINEGCYQDLDLKSFFAFLQVQDSGGHPRQVGHAWCPWNLAARDPREVRRH